jgi:hypothetical protein
MSLTSGRPPTRRAPLGAARQQHRVIADAGLLEWQSFSHRRAEEHPNRQQHYQQTRRQGAVKRIADVKTFDR